MTQQSKLDGEKLTREQLSDVYAAGTSDGEVCLADGEVQIDNASYHAEQKEGSKRP